MMISSNVVGAMLRFPYMMSGQEGKLFTDLEPIKNPFEFGKVDSEGVHKKGFHNRMKEIAKKTKQEPYAKDKEVMQEAKDGAVITGYFTDA